MTCLSRGNSNISEESSPNCGEQENSIGKVGVARIVRHIGEEN